MVRRLTQLLFVLTALVPSTVAMLIGDEHFQDLEGRFWAFYAGGIAIVNPETCQIETEILVDGRGDKLQTDGWNEGVYIQYNNQQTGAATPPAGVTPKLKGYIVINTRTYVNNSDGMPASEVYIFDTEERRMINRVDVGLNVTSAYAIHTMDEVWVHSEEDGYFYIIDISQDFSIDTIKTMGRVQDFIGTPNPGALLWDEKGFLGGTGYSSNVGEQFLFNVDLKNLLSRQNLAVNFTLVTRNCTGLNSLAFVASNFHVYAECSNSGGGILEFNVDNNQVSLVKQHFNVSGYLTELMDGTYVVAVDKQGDKLYLIKPNGNSQASTIVHNLTISGGPEYPAFYNYSAGPTDYTACMPLTTFPSFNVSSSQFREEACYFETSVNQSLFTVKSLTGAVLNPSTCNPNVAKGGVACIDLGGLANGTVTKPTYIRTAGALRQNMTVNESLSELRRSHKRGTKYDASIANYPENSLVIVLMDTMEKKCTVQLSGEPFTVVYAPLNATVIPGVGPQPPTSGGVKLNWGASVVIMVLAYIFA